MDLMPEKISNVLSSPLAGGSGEVRLGGDACSILPEDFFQQMVAFERKRAERSGDPFLCVRIAVKDTVEKSDRERLLRKIGMRISVGFRGTDVCGWFREGEEIGVLCTEMGESDIRLAREIVCKKISGEIARSLSNGYGDLITISSEYVDRVENRGKPDPPVGVETDGDAAHGGCSIGLLGLLQKWLRGTMFLVVGDLAFIFLASLLGNWVRFGDPLNVLGGHPKTMFLTFLAYLAVFYVMDLYNTKRLFGLGEAFFRIAVATALGGLTCNAVFYFFTEGFFGRWLILANILLAVACMALWRLAHWHLIRTSSARTPTLILGAGDCGMAAYRMLNNPFSSFDVKAFLDDDPAKQGVVMGSTKVVGVLDTLDEVVRDWGIGAVVIAISGGIPRKLSRKILEVRLKGVDVLEVPGLYEQMGGRVPVEFIEDRWLAFTKGFDLLSREYIQKVKRLTDVIIAGGMLLASAPVMVLTALAVRLDSPGPVFYTQARVGKGCRVFKLVKFRSMVNDAELRGAEWAARRDPRVTRVGRWIRLFRIDELPQLWNVFKGDMSLVGPRPERPEFVKALETHVPYYSVRHAVHPGITGWAQVNYPYGASLEDALRKLEFDLYYIKNMSLLMDLKILLRTVGVVLLGEGSR